MKDHDYDDTESRTYYNDAYVVGGNSVTPNIRGSSVTLICTRASIIPSLRGICDGLLVRTVMT